MVKPISISRRNGNNRFTKLLGGRRVTKSHLKVEAYGTLDELNSFLGMARAFTKNRIVKEIVLTIQNHLFIIGSELALSENGEHLLKGTVGQREIDWLNCLSIDFKTSLKLCPQFVIYGETQISSILDVGRAVSRRTERLAVKMKSKNMLRSATILEYLNKLSDVLYLLARYEEEKAKRKPKHPSYNQIPPEGHLQTRG